MIIESISIPMIAIENIKIIIKTKNKELTKPFFSIILKLYIFALKFI